MNRLDLAILDLAINHSLKTTAAIITYFLDIYHLFLRPLSHLHTIYVLAVYLMFRVFQSRTQSE